MTVEAGGQWQVLFDRLRTQGLDIWRALPLVEKRQLIRHLRPFWDTHRFRIAPQIGAILDRRIAKGTLMIQAASIHDAAMQSGQFAITLRDRSDRNRRDVQTLDAVITTTGPGHGSILSSQPFLSQLHKSGFLLPDPTGLGIALNETSRVIGIQGPTPLPLSPVRWRVGRSAN